MNPQTMIQMMMTQEMTTNRENLNTLFSLLHQCSYQELRDKMKSRTTFRKGGVYEYVAYIKDLLDDKVQFSAMVVGNVLRVHAPSVRAKPENKSDLQMLYAERISQFFTLLYLLCKAYNLKLVVTSKTFNYPNITTYSNIKLVMFDESTGSMLCTMLNIKQEYKKHVWTFKENLPWHPNQEHVL